MLSTTAKCYANYLTYLALSEPVVLSGLRNGTPALQFNFNNSKKYFPSATFLWTMRLSWKVKVLSTHAVVTANATTASPPIAKLLTEPASNY